MCDTATVSEVGIRKRRIVERPRLFALLDESKARVRTLVAPAGYGKTTLAEQWVARDGRCGAWFTARSSATDVAALALGLARSSTSIVADCDVRLREHMRALPAPAENVETLAEILGEDLAEWPSNAWLVIDEYHEVAQEPRAEHFVAALVSVSPVQFLIASRVRPSWVSTKELMYGDVLEVNQAALAMDNAEAAEVLVERTAHSASGLVSLAHGWPAVIGLASVSSAEIEKRADQLPESFYRFFADEVFSALTSDVQQGLTTLAVAPLLDYELAVSVLGSEVAEMVCAAALDIGLLVERDARLDLHPLARMFLEEHSTQLGLIPSADAIGTCLAVYRDRHDWDTAFDLIVGGDAIFELESLMHDALDELLDGARLATTERWCDAAASAGIVAPIFALARAEMMLRQGRYAEAIAYAESAALGRSQLEFRAFSVAGRAAHLASREEYALALYERSEEASASERERRDAKWGQLGCMIDLELPGSEAALRELKQGVSFGDPRELIRAASQGLYFQMRQGALDLDEADLSSQVLAAVDDPLIRSSFLSAYATGLALAARYDEALAVAESLRNVAEQFRFDFAIPYALCAAAIAHTGSRRWRDAEDAALTALSLSRASRDVHSELLSCSVLLRLYAQQSRFPSGIELDLGRMPGALNASIGEVACSRALVLACAGRTEDALELVDEVRGTSTAVELLVLAASVDAVCAIRSGASDIVERVKQLEATAFQTGAVDLLVTSYRACPELLPILLRAVGGRRFRELVERVGDEDLAGAVGCPIAVNDDKRLLLSRRERDVFELLRTGLTNREIGKLLFIEESTVKAHTNRIYDKLGVHSRSTLTVQAALERASQATSATELRSSDDASNSE